MAESMKNAVFWDVTPFGSCENRRFGGSCHLNHVKRISELGIILAVTRSARSSATSVLTRFTRRHIPGDGIL
jgi:hypothetical protein